MLPEKKFLRDRLGQIIDDKERQGHAVDGLREELKKLPDSYDAMEQFARKLAALPLRDGWPCREPNDFKEILAEFDPARRPDPIGKIDLPVLAQRAETAFISSVCGCILGKPLEVNPTLDEIKSAAEAVNEWPLRDYVTEELLDKLGRRHGSASATTRGKIKWVEPDDDINYTIMGMLILEDHGISFTKLDVMGKWLVHLPIGTTFGPERTMILRAGIHSLTGWPVPPAPFEEWAGVFNPGDEYCGAAIRADAYGYACLGHPQLAAELAWRDASWTHRRTGIYGTMFLAAAIAAAPFAREPLEIFKIALQYVPLKSRFHQIVSDCLQEVAQAKDWLDGYRRIHKKYKQYGHCWIYQECGTIINTLRFAESAGDGICKQVSQGCDTDSFGCRCGSILGAWFGPGHLEARWVEPFNDDLHSGMAWFFERSLSTVAHRMGRLPGLVSEQLQKQK